MFSYLKQKPILILWLIILAGLCFRLAYINIPLLEVVPTRQLETAAIARNFYLHGINLLYPEFDHFGNSNSHLILEFGFFPFLTALGYYLAHGVHEWIGRLISILFSIGTVLVLFQFIKSIFKNTNAALFACLCFYLSPLSIIFTRTFQPESAMLFFTITGLLSAYNYIILNKKIYLIPMLICCPMAILLKITAAYIFLPILYLYYSVYGPKFLFKKSALLTLFFIALPPALWYLWAKIASSAIPYEYSAINWRISNWCAMNDLLTSKYWLKFFEFIIGKTLTPVGFFFLLRSLFKNFSLLKEKKEYGFIFSWLIGVLIYMWIFNSHTLSHKYYYLPLLLVGSVFIGLEAGKPNYGFSQPLPKWIKGIFLALIIIFIPTQLKSAYVLDADYRFTKKAGEKLQEFADKGDLVIASKRLYYCNRKGWRMAIEKEMDDNNLINEFNSYKNQGAKYYVVAELDNFLYHKKFNEYIFKTCTEIYSDKGYKIFKL